MRLPESNAMVTSTRTHSSLIRSGRMPRFVNLRSLGRQRSGSRLPFVNPYPEIPWKLMAGMRDVLIHRYDDVDLDLVWRVTKQSISTLLQAVPMILGCDMIPALRTGVCRAAASLVAWRDWRLAPHYARGGAWRSSPTDDRAGSREPDQVGTVVSDITSR